MMCCLFKSPFASPPLVVVLLILPLVVINCLWVLLPSKFLFVFLKRSRFAMQLPSKQTRAATQLHKLGYGISRLAYRRGRTYERTVWRKWRHNLTKISHLHGSKFPLPLGRRLLAVDARSSSITSRASNNASILEEIRRGNGTSLSTHAH